MELLTGLFPGCCQAGVGDALWVRGAGDDGHFSPGLTRDLVAARQTISPVPGAPATYGLREVQTGRLVQGVGCVHLGPGGCCLGDLKAPLCLGYLCDAARAALAAAAGGDLVGEDSDDFCGAGGAIRFVVREGEAGAQAAVEHLEERLAELGARLAAADFSPHRLLTQWLGEPLCHPV